MAVDFVREFGWGPVSSLGFWVNFFRIPFAGAPHILGSAYLSQCYTSLAGISDPSSAGADAIFAEFEFLDENGRLREGALGGSQQNFIEVQRCVSITIGFIVNEAEAVGGWSFYWLS